MSISSPSSAPRAGLIGTGFIGPVHLEALRRIGVSVTAICDTPARAQLAARRYHIDTAYSDYRDLVNSAEVEVVHITAPNRFHAPMALAAIRAGKHVVCEKPLAMNSRETATIVKAARRARTVFAVNYNVRFYPAVLHLRHLVREGRLGEIIHINGSYLQDWLFKETDYNWRLLPKEGGKLRAVADIGTHWIDTVCFIIGSRVAGVFADLSTFHQRRKRPLGEVQTFTRSTAPTRYASYRVETEDFANVLLEFSGGARGNLAVSQVAAGRKNCIRIEIYGSRQSASWNSEHPEQIIFGHRDTANEVAIRNTPAFCDGATGYMDYPAGHVEGFPDTFKMLFRNVYSAITGDQTVNQLFARPEDGHEEVRICESILKSHRTRRWQRV
jgi:predicted dehydrogenase